MQRNIEAVDLAPSTRQAGIMFKPLIALALLGIPVSALAEAPPIQTPPAATAPSVLQQSVEAELAKAPAGTRFGLLVVDETGQVIVSVNPDQRFIPASNTKLFTTAAAYALLPEMDQPDSASGTQVYLRPGQRKAAPDVVLRGRGDARLSSAPDCTVDCLASLADAVAAKTKLVGDVIGDDTWFPDQRWSPGMSWNNFGSNDATAASALSLDSNELTVQVTAAGPGQPPVVKAPAYVRITNEALTLDGEPQTLTIEHRVNSRDFRLYGEMPVGGAEWNERIGIDDPADYAAQTFAAMLRARGVKVTGKVRVRHRPVTTDRARTQAAEVLYESDLQGWGEPLATLIPPPLAEDVTIVNKVSQNHHAELMLRRIGKVQGKGSLGDGLNAERALFEQAGLPRSGYDFSDGSGMSTYNRVSPRAAVSLLRWAAIQPWGRAWYASLPVAGVDGTLKRRFIGTPLAGNLTAKTGSLNATNALSGTFRGASGRRLTFAFFANDVPDGESALPVMEAVLLLVAAQN